MRFTAQEYCARLERRGYRLIGSGAFSWVYAKPKADKVIKVSWNSWDTEKPKAGDEAWLGFMLWANKSPRRLRHAPKLYALKRYDTFYVALIERVQTGRDVAEHHYETIRELRLLYRSELKDRTIAREAPGELRAWFYAFNRHMQANDLHEGNIGQRADGTIVILDPTTSTSGYTYITNKYGEPRRFKTPSKPRSPTQLSLPLAA